MENHSWQAAPAMQGQREIKSGQEGSHGRPCAIAQVSACNADVSAAHAPDAA